MLQNAFFSLSLTRSLFLQLPSKSPNPLSLSLSLSFSIATLLRRLRPSLRRNLRRLLHPPTAAAAAAAPFNHHTIPNHHNLQFSTGIDQLDSDQAHSGAVSEDEFAASWAA
ncbi:hypothetical protein RIF29_27972 [Crotalaria pallida]|uniref:Uncharacterized protein n=1 Tax=Crotalaria pallida TaxID=3830 RepID=A0AAN9I646_CROPI